MATLTVQSIARTGLNPSYAAAAAGGDVAANPDGKLFLHVKNGSGGSLDVTVTSQIATTAVPQGLAKANVTVAVPAAGDRMIGPFLPDSFNNESGQVAITYSGVTSLTIAAIRLA